MTVNHFLKNASIKRRTGKNPVVTDDNQEKDRDIKISILTKPRKDVTSRRAGLRIRNRVYYNQLANPKVNKLIQLPKKTHVSEWEKL